MVAELISSSGFSAGVYTYFWGTGQEPCTATCEKHGDVLFRVVDKYWRCTHCLGVKELNRQGMLFV